MIKTISKMAYTSPVVEMLPVEDAAPLCLSVFSGFFADDTGSAGAPGEVFFGNDEQIY